MKQFAWKKKDSTSPLDPGGYSLLGVALRHNGKDIEAEQAHRRSIHIDPKYEEAYFNLGVNLLDDRPSEAQALFRTAIDLEPSDAWTHIYLGTYLWGCANLEAAVAEFRTASELKPDWAFPLVSLGNIYELEFKDLNLAQSFFDELCSWSRTMKKPERNSNAS